MVFLCKREESIKLVSDWLIDQPAFWFLVWSLSKFQRKGGRKITGFGLTHDFLLEKQRETSNGKKSLRAEIRIKTRILAEILVLLFFVFSSRLVGFRFDCLLPLLTFWSKIPVLGNYFLLLCVEIVPCLKRERMKHVFFSLSFWLFFLKLFDKLILSPPTYQGGFNLKITLSRVLLLLKTHLLFPSLKF